jgi:endoglucanase
MGTLVFKASHPLSVLGFFLVCLVFMGSLLPGRGWAASANTALTQSWQYFKTHFMVNTNRVPSQTFGGVISEGQSYAMLMAWKMHDKVTFDKTWQWTKTHMKRPNDHLFGWKWGQFTEGPKKGQWGVLDPNNATDADQDIAYALLRAGLAWQRPDYVAEAKALINDLWVVNVVKLTRRYYLTAGPWEGLRTNGMIHLAPGYFAPHVYKWFAKVDKAHPWRQLASDGYGWLEACSNLAPSGLPGNWCGISLEDEAAHWSDVQGDGARDFGYDVVRIFWRLSQDRRDPKAKAYAIKHQTLNHFWEQNGTVPGGFNADGSPKWDMPSAYGRSALVAQWLTMTPDISGEACYKVALSKQYHPEGYWQDNSNYFLPAVVWLSVAVTQGDW